MNFPLLSFVRHSTDALCQAVKRRLRQWTKPDNHTLVLNAAVDLTRSKSELVLENALLRQQLIVLQRQEKRPALTWRERSKAGRGAAGYALCSQEAGYAAKTSGTEEGEGSVCISPPACTGGGGGDEEEAIGVLSGVRR